jgi:hypothetical protein
VSLARKRTLSNEIRQPWQGEIDFLPFLAPQVIFAGWRRQFWDVCVTKFRASDALRGGRDLAGSRTGSPATATGQKRKRGGGALRAVTSAERQ